MGKRKARRRYIRAVLASPRIDRRIRERLARIWQRYPEAIELDGELRTEVAPHEPGQPDQRS